MKRTNEEPFGNLPRKEIRSTDVKVLQRARDTTASKRSPKAFTAHLEPHVRAP